MDDPLQERTRRLVTDFLTFCAREPGVPESPPTSVEAELLRSLAARMQRQHEAFFSTFFGYQGNRVELVRQMADGMFSDGQNFNWGRLVLLLTFAGTLLNQNHSQATRQKTGLNNPMQVTRDCHLIVDLLCSQLLRHHRLWLEAHDGWVRPHAKRGRDGVWGWGGGAVLNASQRPGALQLYCAVRFMFFLYCFFFFLKSRCRVAQAGLIT